MKWKKKNLTDKTKNVPDTINKMCRVIFTGCES